MPATGAATNASTKVRREDRNLCSSASPTSTMSDPISKTQLIDILAVGAKEVNPDRCKLG